MQNLLDVYQMMSTSGPWEVRKTDHSTYKVVSGQVIIADCPKLWDAEFIVFLYDRQHDLKSLQEQVARLKEEIDVIKHGVE